VAEAQHLQLEEDDVIQLVKQRFAETKRNPR
jgi:hypothetical protein